MTTKPLPCYDLYRVIADYTPPEEHRATGYLTVMSGDILEVERPSQQEDGPARQLKGQYSETITCGLVVPRNVVAACDVHILSCDTPFNSSKSCGVTFMHFVLRLC